MKLERSELEKLVVQIQDGGQAWIEAKLKSDQLVDGEKNFLAALMNDLEKQFKNTKMSEAKLDRLARGTVEFQNYVVGKALAIAETGRKKIRYEALQSLWEAKRSELSFERAKLEKGIYHEGRG
jgi:hypothetical protein